MSGGGGLRPWLRPRRCQSCPPPSNDSAMWGGPVDGAVYFMEPPPTTDYAAAANKYMQHRFEPRLQEAGVPYAKEILLEATEPSVQVGWW